MAGNKNVPGGKEKVKNVEQLTDEELGEVAGGRCGGPERSGPPVPCTPVMSPQYNPPCSPILNPVFPGCKPW